MENLAKNNFRKIPCVNCGEKTFKKRLKVNDPLDKASELTVVTCKSCGLCFLNPQYSFESYIEFYEKNYFDALGSDYIKAKEDLKSAYRSHMGDQFYSFISEISQHDKYLDIAAGTGTWLEILIDKNQNINQKNITVIEPSTLACRNLKSRHPSINIVQKALENNGLPREYFDYVLCSALIEHFTDPLTGLLEMNRLMKKGGRLLLMTPSLEKSSFHYGAARFFKFVHTFYFTSKSLNNITKKAGFKIISIKVIEGDTKSGLIWFPMLFAVYEKAEDIESEKIGLIQKQSKLDRVSLEESDLIFNEVKFKLLHHIVQHNFKLILKRMITNLLEVKSKLII